MAAPPRPASTARTRQAAALGPFPAADFVLPGVLLAAITLAEIVTAMVDARFGLPAHAAILGLLVTLGARTSDFAKRELYWTLTLAPVIRIGSLCLPLGQLPLLSWYPLIGVPIFTAAFVAARKLGYRPAMIGLTLRASDLPRQLALVPVGAILGIGEYLIFRPAPLADEFTFEAIWLPALILLIFTGFEEELIFRGLMQRAALRALGRWGLVYTNLIFAVLHIGYESILDLVFVFLVGMLFSVFALRTRSIFGVTLAHGAVNISLFLILPFLAPVFLGSGRADLLPLPVPPSAPSP
jgi:membrane protease YdiL (CAAX protease family)